MSDERLIALRLPREMIGQIVDGLETLAADWEFTSRCGSQRYCPPEEDLHMRECRDSDEAAKIAGDYREIIDVICEQLNR